MPILTPRSAATNPVINLGTKRDPNIAEKYMGIMLELHASLL